MGNEVGPKSSFSDDIHKTKYRLHGETFRGAGSRFSQALTNDPESFQRLYKIYLSQLFLPAGRLQASIGSPQKTTAFNCFVSGTIHDSMDSIMDRAKEAAQTMRLGGGIGYDFSTLRPRDAIITTLGSKSSGAISFMGIFDAVCSTVASAGDRRGAQMGVLRVDHPDIEEFIEVKTNEDKLTNFNLSVGITDEFMECVRDDKAFALRFEGVTYKVVSARMLWEKIMRSTWDWAEPGVLFIDTINRMNNLYYCETIASTNPCAEEPLPSYGACLLGSYNLTKYSPEVIRNTVYDVVKALDTVIDISTYPLKEQEISAKSKRRMGIGVTGLANYIESLGQPYGSQTFLDMAESIFKELVHGAYRASIKLATERGPFELFNRDKYLASEFIKTLPEDIREGIYENGIRNSHLISFAPAGTISITADNVSSGIEPTFCTSYNRTVIVDGVSRVEAIEDYGYKYLDCDPKIADKCSVSDHLGVLSLATRYSDSAVSKTINVGDSVTWDEFKEIYYKAWLSGCKGCTTYRASGKRYGILAPSDGESCYIDPATGQKSCS